MADFTVLLQIGADGHDFVTILTWRAVAAAAGTGTGTGMAAAAAGAAGCVLAQLTDQTAPDFLSGFMLESFGLGLLQAGATLGLDILDLDLDAYAVRCGDKNMV